MVKNYALGNSHYSSKKKSTKKKALSSMKLSDLDNESSEFESKDSVSNRHDSSLRLVAS